MTGSPGAAPAPPLDPEMRARGRRLAIGSHPFGMTHRTIFTEWVPTLALVELGASEAVIGVQGALEPLGQMLQLPTLRAVGRFSKRSLLVAGQCLSLVGGLPLLFFASLHGPAAQLLVLGALAVSTLGIVIAQTVWFPLLRSYVEPDRIGRFFGALRSFWHVALIAFFLAASGWLELRPGQVAPLFALGLVCGVVRVVLIARLPERSERIGSAIRVREALALLRTEPALRRYLLGVACHGAIRSSTLPFVIVMMRRVAGLSDSEVMLVTVASFAGGLFALYLAGRIVDTVGPARVFFWTALGLAGTLLALAGVREPGPFVLWLLVGIFFVRAALTAGFGVADTRVLFDLTPEAAPARMLVVSAVVVAAVRGTAPFLVGIALDLALAAGEARETVYPVLFGVAAVLQLGVFLPLRGFRPGS